MLDFFTPKVYALLATLLLFPIYAWSQSAVITEELQELDTYGFGTPNPVPILTENPKIFPYYKFEDYEHTSQKRAWKVIKLENDYIEVYILPEVGGKVWGAIEKSTGNEFLYRNDVVKFRNIAMRGPWTSGGIEFNFGIIGHHPSTATPVDYVTKENSDGSVSCVVGNLDLPSRTYWQVEIKLEKDKAYFETNASWYNGTKLNQSYYNWMTGAAPATNDLEFFVPGNGYLEHGGTWQKWPIDDQGRNLAMYKNNNFGPSKSYHVVGSYENYFGGYYHDRNVGFGHLSAYEEMPGQKLWLWALSRFGGIWEDLLTDTDGQYIEFQAGRLFNQYFPESENPISQANFDPYVMDSWQEQWFPIKEIGGMEAASKYALLNVERNGDEATLGINALQAFEFPLQILINGKEVSLETLEMTPMQVFEKTIPCKEEDILEVILGKDKLHYTSNKEETFLKRSFVDDSAIEISEAEKLYHEASEAMKYREYKLAKEHLSNLLGLDPRHTGALLLQAEAEYRKTRYDETLKHANTVLQLDIYNAGANYMAGIAYWAKNDALNALESLGWAARSMAYRSVAYAQMAEIYLNIDDIEKAINYAYKALDFNQYNLNAKQVLLVAYRKSKQTEAFTQQLDEVLEISPINHFATFEKIKSEGKEGATILKHIQNEFSQETVLELALTYLSLGQEETAFELLSLNGNDSKSKLLLAFAFRKEDADKSQTLLSSLENGSPNFVFPYRQEMVPVLEWAVSTNNNWKFKYYLAQNYLAVGLNDKAKVLLNQCGDTPNNDAFYIFRAKILVDASYEDKWGDYQKALDLEDTQWKNWNDLMLFYLENAKNTEAVELGKNAVKKFPNNYNVGFSYAKALLATNNYAKAIAVLKDLNILPFEHASESKDVYSDAHIFLAKQHMDKNQFSKAVKLLEAAKEWPENLGVGAPYNPDERLPHYLLGMCHEKLGKQEIARKYFQEVAGYQGNNGLNALFSLLSYNKLNMENEKQQLLEKMEENKASHSSHALITAFYQKDLKSANSIAASQNIDQRLMDIFTYCLGE